MKQIRRTLRRLVRKTIWSVMCVLMIMPWNLLSLKDGRVNLQGDQALAASTVTMTSKTDWSGADYVETNNLDTATSSGDVKLAPGGKGLMEGGFVSAAPFSTATGASLAYDSDNNYIWSMPGYSSNYAYLRRLWRYDLSKNIWTNMADAPGVCTTGCAMTYKNGYVYATMGSTTGFYRYSVATNSWTTMTSAPGAFGYGAALTYDTVNHKIYATRGGSIDFYSYDVAANTWSNMNSVPTTVTHGGGAVYLGGMCMWRSVETPPLSIATQ